MLNNTTGLSNQACINQLAGTSGLLQKDAFNIWAGTSYLSRQEAANVKAGTTNLSLQAALNRLVDPSQISDLIIWVKADYGVYSNAGTSLAVNNGTVQQWNNLASGGNFTQTSSDINKPLYITGAQNGLPAIRFDGSDDYLTNTTATGTAAQTIFVACKSIGASVFGRRFFARNNASASVYDNSGAFAYWANQAGTGENIGGTHSSPILISLNYASASSVQAYINGAATGSAFDPSDIYTTTGFTLGAEANTGGSPKNCDIYEVIVYNHSLTESEMLIVTQYLGNKWGISIA